MVTQGVREGWRRDALCLNFAAKHYTRRGGRLLRLFVGESWIGGSGHAALPVGSVDFSGGVIEKRPAAGFAIFVGSGNEFKSRIIWIGTRRNAISKFITALFAGGDAFVEERGSVWRDVALGCGAKLRERVGHFAVGAAVGLNGVGDSPQGVDRGGFLEFEILIGPLFGELRNVDEDKAERKETPAARFADEAEFVFLAVDNLDGNEGEIFAHAGRAEAEFDCCIGSLAADDGVAECVGRDERAAGGIGESESADELYAFFVGEGVECGGAVCGQVSGELGLVRAAGRGNNGAERGGGVCFFAFLSAS